MQFFGPSDSKNVFKMLKPLSKLLVTGDLVIGLSFFLTFHKKFLVRQMIKIFKVKRKHEMTSYSDNKFCRPAKGR